MKRSNNLRIVLDTNVFLVSNDKHFRILKDIEFPPIKVITLEEFEKMIYFVAVPNFLNGFYYTLKTTYRFTITASAFIIVLATTVFAANNT